MSSKVSKQGVELLDEDLAPLGTETNPLSTGISDGTQSVTLTNDAGVIRLEVGGKVALTGAAAPPGTSSQLISADTPLTVGSHDTTFTIPDGETFHLQTIVAGNEDPTKGAVVEVFFDDGSEHLVERVYTNGRTLAIPYSDVTEARDGTPLLGDSGGTTDIIVRRAKYSGTDIAVDAVVVGYTS